MSRSYLIWKEASLLSWLEENVKKVITKVDNKDPQITDEESKRSRRYKTTPRNVIRHILLTEIKEAAVGLPQVTIHLSYCFENYWY